MELVGTDGSIRTWWSGAEDRTREPAFEIKVQRAGSTKPEKVHAEASGELFELDMELCLAVEAFRKGEPIVTGVPSILISPSGSAA